MMAQDFIYIKSYDLHWDRAFWTTISKKSWAAASPDDKSIYQTSESFPEGEKVYPRSNSERRMIWAEEAETASGRAK